VKPPDLVQGISKKFKQTNEPVSLWTQEGIGSTIRGGGETSMRKLALVGSVALLCTRIAWAQDERPAKKATTREALQTEIEGLKPTKVAWREIAWKSCLLEGLKESRAKNKPALLWVFIDRPIDDARC
jgi:hypothetical protein